MLRELREVRDKPHGALGGVPGGGAAQTKALGQDPAGCLSDSEEAGGGRVASHTGPMGS